jgi:predicted O-methyltransferase YrrM
LRYSEICEYVAKFVGQGDYFQVWLWKESADLRNHGVFPIDPNRGRVLELLARMKSAKRVLEIGSGAGYSALWFMKGMDSEGTLDAIEHDKDVVEVLADVVKKRGLTGRVRIHRGPALAILKGLRDSYDIVFIDADKSEYSDYLAEAMRLTKRGGIIVADNMLWRGATVTGKRLDEGARAIMAYTKAIFSDERLSSIIIPLGDGLAVSCRVR